VPKTRETPTGGRRGTADRGLAGHAARLVLGGRVGRWEGAGRRVLVAPRQGDGVAFAHLLDPSGNHFGVSGEQTS
jgi:uncharacterized protein